MPVAARRPVRAALAATALAAALLALAPSAAFAAERIVAVPQSTYATQNVAIDQGEPLTFLNLDALNHDVTARGTDSAGSPLFSTPLIGPGQEVPVTGAEKLTPGDYAFFCTIHANMEGTLKVGGGGSGGGGGGGDSQGPALAVKVLDKKVSEVRKAGIVRVQVTTDEGAGMSVKVKAKSDGDSVTLGKAAHDFPESGTHQMDVTLTKSGKAALRGGGKVKLDVKVDGTDAAGNTSTEKAKATLK